MGMPEKPQDHQRTSYLFFRFLSVPTAIAAMGCRLFVNVASVTDGFFSIVIQEQEFILRIKGDGIPFNPEERVNLTAPGILSKARASARPIASPA